VKGSLFSFATVSSIICEGRPQAVIIPMEPIRSFVTLIHRVVVRRICRLYPSGKMAGPVCVLLLSLLPQGCARPTVHEPVTLTLLDQEWTTKTFSEARQQELQQFTRETGIHVKLLASPESPREQLAFWRELLGTSASGPDVYGLDVIWPGMLAESFIDLKPYFANEMSAEFPAVAASYTVDNKLVALPYDANIGLLYFRTDLLRRYGYRVPPQTWDELERMAARIQAGERAKGKKEFWGFVWQGAAVEGLTCDALEWQASEGGGRIIAGDAAFMRSWPMAYVDSQATDSPIRNKFDITLLPAGKAGRVGTLGGVGLAVSRFSAHTNEALELVRYLCSRKVQLERSRVLSEPPTFPELYELAGLREPNPRYAVLAQAFRTAVISRPSSVTGKNYQDVTDAYMQAVHSVLTGEKRALEAAATLEKELVRITGFKTGPPSAGMSGTTVKERSGPVH